MLFSRRALGLTVALVAGAVSLADAAPVAVNFTIDSTQSSITFNQAANLDNFLGSPFGLIPATPQSPGVSDVTKVGGSVTSMVDLSAGTIDLSASSLELKNSGNWTPASLMPSPGTTAPANYGHFLNLSVAGRLYSAIRNTIFGIVGNAALSGSGTYTFPTNVLNFNIIHSDLDFDGAGGLLEPNVPSDTTSTDNSDPVAMVSGNATLTLTGSTLDLVMPVHAVAIALISGGPDFLNLDFVGQIHATGTYAPPPPSLVGDANGDCSVGAADYAIWAAQFGQAGADLAADFDDNGSVGAGDYALWAANFGNTCPPAAAGASVPEPSSCVLAALAAIGLLAGRRRRAA